MMPRPRRALRPRRSGGRVRRLRRIVRGSNYLRRTNRIKYNPRPSFVETFSGGPLYANTGGCLGVTFDSVPQWTKYANLYKMFRINSFEVMIVPRFGDTERNQGYFNLTSNTAGSAAVLPVFQQPRLAFAINNSPNPTIPSSELQLLEDNGAKIRILDGHKLTKLYSKAPVANMSVTDFGAAVPHTFAIGKPRQFVDIDSGHDIRHYGIGVWTTQTMWANPPGIGVDLPAPQVAVADMIFKISFTLKDPR